MFYLFYSSVDCIHLNHITSLIHEINTINQTISSLSVFHSLQSQTNQPKMDLRYHRYPRNPETVTITLTQTFSLIRSLIYLQCLYALSSLYGLIWNFHPAWPPFRHSRRRTEDRIVGICLSIAPTSACRSVLAARQYNESRMSVPRIVSGSCYVGTPSAFPQPATLPQCYPESAVERTTPIGNVFRFDSTSSLSLDGQSSQNGSIVGNSMRKIVAGRSGGGGGRAKSPVVVTATAPQHQQQQQKREETPPQPPAQPAPPNQQDRQPETKFTTVNHQPKQIADPLPRPSLRSSSSSLEHSHSVPERLSGVSPWRMKRWSKYRSAESYPGRFPVSYGLEYSSLATAAYRFPGRGATSVRPFSDM